MSTTESAKCDTHYLNVGKDHWGYCEQHGLRWWIGYNLFSSWQYETEADWAWNRALLEDCREACEGDESICEGYARRGWEDRPNDSGSSDEPAYPS